MSGRDESLVTRGIHPGRDEARPLGEGTGSVGAAVCGAGVGQPLRTVATTPSTKKLFDVLTVVVTGEMMAQFAILVVRPKVLLVTFMPWNAPLPFSARLMVQPPPSIVFLSMVTLETTPWSWVTCTPVLKAPEMLLPTIRMLLPFWIWIESSWLGVPPWFGSDWKCTLSCR